MLTARNSDIAKKDLHVGGIGSRASIALATMSAANRGQRPPGAWFDSARARLWDANDALRGGAWGTVGLVAVGLAAGYWLARRS